MSLAIPALIALIAFLSLMLPKTNWNVLAFDVILPLVMIVLLLVKRRSELQWRFPLTLGFLVLAVIMLSDKSAALVAAKAMNDAVASLHSTATQPFASTAGGTFGFYAWLITLALLFHMMVRDWFTNQIYFLDIADKHNSIIHEITMILETKTAISGMTIEAIGDLQKRAHTPDGKEHDQ